MCTLRYYNIDTQKSMCRRKHIQDTCTEKHTNKQKNRSMVTLAHLVFWRNKNKMKYKYYPDWGKFNCNIYPALAQV